MMSTDPLDPDGKVRCGQGYAGAAASQQSPALWLEEFHTADPAQIGDFLFQAYDGAWRTTTAVPGPIHHRRYHARQLRLDELTLGGRVRCVLRPQQVMVVAAGDWLRGGEQALQGPDEPTVVTSDRPCVLDLDDARMSVLSMDAQLLRRVAAERSIPLPPTDIRFHSSLPRSPDDSQILRRTMAFVHQTFATSFIARRPLLVAAAVDAAAAAVLECYPTNVARGQRVQPDASNGDTLSRSLNFIHQHVGEAISIGDIAVAVNLTPRAVQYLFRGRLDTTPTEYLRRVRLHRAHQELAATEASTTSVGEIAARWGFSHMGRFAALYRHTYGVSPHATLQGRSFGT